MAGNGTNDVMMKKGAWSSEEDVKLIAYIRRYGIWNWNHMASPAGLCRSGKSCRLRWMNYLRPNLRHGNFSQEEEDIIIKWQQLVGNKWSLISSKLEGRTDNEVKNYWNTRLKKRSLDQEDSAEMTNKSEIDQESSINSSSSALTMTNRWIKKEEAAEPTTSDDTTTTSDLHEILLVDSVADHEMCIWDDHQLYTTSTVVEHDDFDSVLLMLSSSSSNYAPLLDQQYCIDDNLWDY